MTDERKRRSSFMLFMELIKDIFVFLDIELRLAKAEVKRNIGAAGKAIVLLAAGSLILILALLAIVTAGIAALNTVLPLWLASLAVAAILVLSGAALVLAGRVGLRKSLLVPTKSLARVKTILKKLASI